MIALLAANPRTERFLQEITAPLAVETDTYTPGQTADRPPELAIIWWEEGEAAPEGAEALCQQAGRTIVIATGKAPADAAREWGPDTIFTAPLRPGRITQQVRTFLRAGAKTALPEQITLGPYDFYPKENRVHDKKEEKNQRLTDKERDIILTLHAAAGTPVSRQALLDTVWAYAPDVETHTLETHIYRLRQKIEKDPSAPQIILTDEAGYKIIPA